MLARAEAQRGPEGGAARLLSGRVASRPRSNTGAHRIDTPGNRRNDRSDDCRGRTKSNDFRSSNLRGTDSYCRDCIGDDTATTAPVDDDRPDDSPSDRGSSARDADATTATTPTPTTDGSSSLEVRLELLRVPPDRVRRRLSCGQGQRSGVCAGPHARDRSGYLWSGRRR